VQKRNSLTSILIVVISGAYIVANYFSNLIPGIPLQERLFLIKYALLSDGMAHGIQAGEYYRYFTVALTHANLTHILFNMLALYSLGTAVEKLLWESEIHRYFDRVTPQRFLHLELLCYYQRASSGCIWNDLRALRRDLGNRPQDGSRLPTNPGSCCA
jgi:membrane associated rhomboid family serine protease